MTANPNIKPSDMAAVVGVINPDAYAAGAESTGWVSFAEFEAMLAVISVGDFVATGLLDAKLEQATDGTGTGVKDVTGKAITQLTAAGTDDDKEALINIRAEEMDVANSFTHVRLTMTLTTAGADAAGYLLGFHPHDEVASASDAATVDEIIA